MRACDFCLEDGRPKETPGVAILNVSVNAVDNKTYEDTDVVLRQPKDLELDICARHAKSLTPDRLVQTLQRRWCKP